MKILIASDVYPPHLSGGAKHVQYLSQELNRRGHQVIVCTTALDDKYTCDKENGIKVHWLPGLFPRFRFLYRSSDRFPPPISDSIMVKQLQKIVLREKPDIVHTYSWIVQSIIPALKSFNIPLILSVQDYRAICPAAGMVEKAAVCGMSLGRHCMACSRYVYGFGPMGMLKSAAVYFATKVNKSSLRNSINKFVACSVYVKQAHMQALGLQEADIIVIPHFFGGDIIKQEERVAGLPEDFILFVGRLSPEKGVDILINAYHQLNTETKLVLIVANPRYHYENTENLIVIEDAPHPLVMQAYKSCRFAVFPSIWPEPYGLVTLEAMSQKKAIITSNMGGFTDIVVDGKTGFLVSPHDVKAISQAMKYLLDNPETTIKMGQEGYKRWRELFTPEVVVPRMESLYKSLL